MKCFMAKALLLFIKACFHSTLYFATRIKMSFSINVFIIIVNFARVVPYMHVSERCNADNQHYSII